MKYFLDEKLCAFGPAMLSHTHGEKVQISFSQHNPSFIKFKNTINTVHIQKHFIIRRCFVLNLQWLAFVTVISMYITVDVCILCVYKNSFSSGYPSDLFQFDFCFSFLPVTIGYTCFWTRRGSKFCHRLPTENMGEDAQPIIRFPKISFLIFNLLSFI